VDKLRGLKENVILGKLIPSQILADEESSLQSDNSLANLLPS